LCVLKMPTRGYKLGFRSLLIVLLAVTCNAFAGKPIAVKTEKYTLDADNLAVVINDADPVSVEVGEYYHQARKIPAENLIHVRIEGKPHKISLLAFNVLKQEIEKQLPANIEAIVLIWTAPYAVECNSITSALTLGFDAQQCENPCGPGRLNPYYNSDSVKPLEDLGLRPTMLLPTESASLAKSLIDRGVQSASMSAPAIAYLLSTSDKLRNVRAKFYPPSGVFPQKKLAIRVMKTDYIENLDDVMLYSTGLAFVPKLETIHFVPGALADHLTSAGGDLLGQAQMSSLRWLDAGATASYGAVSEPCNYPQKFPQPSLLLKHYLSGASAIEAYWKSVAWPAQGVFIGEPLAAPYR
jgi:uncharacterized protein (TIGR03790 family)